MQSAFQEACKQLMHCQMPHHHVPFSSPSAESPLAQKARHPLQNQDNTAVTLGTQAISGALSGACKGHALIPGAILVTQPCKPLTHEPLPASIEHTFRELLSLPEQFFLLRLVWLFHVALPWRHRLALPSST